MIPFVNRSPQRLDFLVGSSQFPKSTLELWGKRWWWRETVARIKTPWPPDLGPSLCPKTVPMRLSYFLGAKAVDLGFGRRKRDPVVVLPLDYLPTLDVRCTANRGLTEPTVAHSLRGHLLFLFDGNLVFPARRDQGDHEKRRRWPNALPCSAFLHFFLRFHNGWAPSPNIDTTSRKALVDLIQEGSGRVKNGARVRSARAHSAPGPAVRRILPENVSAETSLTGSGTRKRPAGPIHIAG